MEVKLSIKGYENSDTLPLTALKDSIQFVLSDTSVKEIVSGMIQLRFKGGGRFYNLKTESINSYKIMFFDKPPNPKGLSKPYLFFSFCVKVKKDGEIFTIPSRKYLVTTI